MPSILIFFAARYSAHCAVRSRSTTSAERAAAAYGAAPRLFCRAMPPPRVYALRAGGLLRACRAARIVLYADFAGMFIA